MPTGTIRVILDGKNDEINAVDFLGLIRDTVSILRSFDEESRWIIASISRKSPLTLDLQSDSEESNAAVLRFVDNLAVLEKEDRRPRGADDRVLKRLKRISTHLNNGISKLTYVAADREPLHVSQRVAASVDAIVHAPSYESYTELEGELGQITVHGGKAEFCIFDPITDRPTTCRFNPDDAESVGALITHRIRVYGKARYSRTHRPESIKVEEWEGPLGEKHPISLSDLHDAGFTLDSDRTSDEIIRRQRNLDD